MTTVRPTVVVGVADKQTAAVRYAVAEAERLNRRLRVVHCWVAPMPTAALYVGAATVAEMRQEGMAVLDGARTTVAETSSAIEVDYILADGAPVNVLLEEAEQAETLVIGVDDVPWIERFLGGVASGHLATSAKCPVVVVPDRDGPRAVGGGVVVTVDGETSARGPLRYAFEAAGARGEDLHVLHVIPHGSTPDQVESRGANLAEVMAGWQDQFPEVAVTRSTSAGSPADECIAATTEASLVVIGRHNGHTKPFGRSRQTAISVVRGARCPVAVVPLDHGVL